MKIILMGNVCSGKSSLARLVKKDLPNLEFTSIDAIRCLHGDGSQEKEEECKHLFMEAVHLQAAPQMIELSGVGISGERLMRKLNAYKGCVYVFVLAADINTLLARTVNRRTKIPFPLPKSNIPNAISFTQKEFEGGLIHRLQSHCPKGIFLLLWNANIAMRRRNRELIVRVATGLAP